MTRTFPPANLLLRSGLHTPARSGLTGRATAAGALALAFLLLPGCQGPQSTLNPAGPDAVAVFTLGNVMYAGAAAIFLLVAGATAWAMATDPGRAGFIGRRSFVVAAGIAFPVAVLSALLVYGLTVSAGTLRPGTATVRIEVIGELWWWRINYLGPDGAPAFATANEIRIPTGEPVEFVLTSPNVIHSFWIPSLGGKLDMIPGRVNRLVLQADRAGIYRGQCAEYCGAQHALMAFDVVAQDGDAQETWLAVQASPARAPETDEQRRGADLFRSLGCGACHTIRGTDAAGLVGPDLTHVGSRLGLAAAALPNSMGAMAGWISDAQGHKPGSFMPSFNTISGPDLRALAAYLENLK